MLIAAIRVSGGVETLVALLVDGNEIDGAVGSNTWFPYRVADVNRVREPCGVSPA